MSTRAGALRQAPKTLLFAVFALLFPVLGGCGKKAVATVNGIPITEQEFLQRCASAVPQADPFGSTVGIQVLRHLISVKLLEQEARRLNLLPTDEEVRQLLDFHRSDTEMRAGRSFGEVLAQQGRTEEDVRRDIRESLLIHKYRYHDVQVTDEEIRQFFNQRKHQLGLPPRVRISVIRTKTRQEIESIRRELDNRAAFEILAQREANVDLTRETGGLIPHDFTPNDPTIEKEILDTAFRLNVGEHSRPLRVGMSWVIVKVNEKKEAVEPDFNRLRPVLAMRLQEERGEARAAEANRRMMELMQRAQVTVHWKQYEAAMAQLLRMSAAAGPGGGPPPAPGSGETPGHEGHGH